MSYHLLRLRAPLWRILCGYEAKNLSRASMNGLQVGTSIVTLACFEDYLALAITCPQSAKGQKGIIGGGKSEWHCWMASEVD